MKLVWSSTKPIPRMNTTKVPKEINSMEEFLMPFYQERVSRNKHYSRRAFARDLGISSGRLTTIMNSENIPTAKVLERIKSALNLNKKQSQELENLVQHLKVKRAQERADVIIGEKDLDVILDWVPFALLSFMETTQYNLDVNYLSRRLDVDEARVLKALAQLKELGLIVPSEGSWKPAAVRIATTTGIPSERIQASHQQKLQLAAHKMARVDQSSRDFSSITFPTNPENLVAAKKLIVEFRRNLANLMQVGEKTEVYSLNIQLFPLTAGEQNVSI